MEFGNHKIIGFTVSRKPIDHSGVDIFHANLTFKRLIVAEWHVYLWGIGDLERCFFDEKNCSLSFPLTQSLEDRNVLITLSQERVVIRNDWLGSIPVFYCVTGQMVSTLFTKVSQARCELDDEGLADYLDFGYSVFEQTPLKDVKFLRYSAMLTLGRDGTISMSYENDMAPAEVAASGESDVSVVIETVREYMRNAGSTVAGPLIVPTSGGYDSRLLLFLLDDKSRARSFSFGISDDQSKSSEVVLAKAICDQLRVEWQQVQLGAFHKYIPEWLTLYGCSTHLHGMYQMEFYEKVRQCLGFAGGTVVSGIVGDAWSGKVKPPVVRGPRDVVRLRYSHGGNLPPNSCRTRSKGLGRSCCFTQYNDHWKDDKFRIVMLVRTKMMLLSYLLAVPEYLGFPAWTPFLNKRVVFGMLSLPANLREGRRWQRDLFRANGICPDDDDTLKVDRSNTLNLNALRQQCVEIPDSATLDRLVRTRFRVKLERKYDVLLHYVACGGKPFSLSEYLDDKLHYYRRLHAWFGLKLNPSTLMTPYGEVMILKSLAMSLDGTKECMSNGVR